MNLIQCGQCGEVLESERFRRCPGCNGLLPGSPGRRAGRRSEAQRQAGQDSNLSRGILVAMGVLTGAGLAQVITGSLLAVLIAGAIGALVSLALTANSPGWGTGETPSTVAASPARPAETASRPVTETDPSGCKTVAMVVGVVLASILGLAVAVFVACMYAISNI